MVTKPNFLIIVTDDQGYGDLTAFRHHGYTIHGAPINSTDKSRWSFLFSYSPADTRYWNGAADNWGTHRKHLSDEQNPMLYFPGDENE